MHPPRPTTTIAAVLVAGLALGACDALDGDLAPSAAVGVAAGDVAATAFDGEVIVTVDELAEAVEGVLGVDRIEIQTAPDPRSYIATQQQVLALLVQEAVYGGAAEEQFGLVITDEDVDDQIQQLVDEAGGEEELAAFLASQGSSIEQERRTLALRLLAPQVADALVEQSDGGDGNELLREWSREAMAEADPVVARRFGAWDPVSLTLVPADEVSSGAQATS